MVLHVNKSALAELGYDLLAEVQKFQTALKEHASTVDKPAPVSDPLVEHIVRVHDGRVEIDEDDEESAAVVAAQRDAGR